MTLDGYFLEIYFLSLHFLFSSDNLIEWEFMELHRSSIAIFATDVRIDLFRESSCMPVYIRIDLEEAVRISPYDELCMFPSCRIRTSLLR